MLIIRPMRIEDIDDVYAIEVKAYPAPWNRSLLSDCVMVGYDCRVLEKNDDHGKTMLGYIISRIASGSCHILNICVAKAHQNQGLGKFFLSQVLASLEERLLDTVILEVRPSNLAALALYKSFDFEVVELKKDYYVDINAKEDALVLRKKI